jgi:toxin FitB
VTFLLDANVVSEPFKPRPDSGVLTWLADTDEDRMYISVVSLAEIRRGIELLELGNRRGRLESWLVEELPLRFERRVLAVGAEIADVWGVFMALARRNGVGLGAMDAFLAATASTHGLTLVTRNTSDFARLGIGLLNPWLPPG